MVQIDVGSIVKWLMVLRWTGLVVRGLGSKGVVVVGGLTAMLTMAKAVLLNRLMIKGKDCFH